MQKDGARLKDHLVLCEKELQQCMREVCQDDGNRLSGMLHQALDAVQKARTYVENPLCDDGATDTDTRDVHAIIARVKAQVKHFIHERCAS